MGKKRRRFTDQFKAKVALEAVRGVKTLAELAAQYQVHPNHVSQWKKQLLSQARDVFSDKSSDSGKTTDEMTAPLYEEIGRLKMDIKWLKKSFEPAACNSSDLGRSRTRTIPSGDNAGWQVYFVLVFTAKRNRSRKRI